MLIGEILKKIKKEGKSAMKIATLKEVNKGLVLIGTKL